MSDLHWFSGITGDTPIRDIGWTWVLLVAAIVAVVCFLIHLWRIW